MDNSAQLPTTDNHKGPEERTVAVAAAEPADKIVKEKLESVPIIKDNGLDLAMDTSGDLPEESVLKEAMSYMAKGKRLRAMDDVQSAADYLEQACQLFDAYYGVGKRQCADAYLEYGLALTSLANLEAGNGTEKLLKKAGIEGDSDGENDEEEEDDEEGSGDNDDEEEEETATNGATVQDGAKATSDNGEKQTDLNKEASSGDTNNEEKKDVSMEAEPTPAGAKTNEIETNTSASKPDQQQPGPSAGTSIGTNGTNGAQNDLDKSDDEAANEEPTTIEIAWEVLCLARRVFELDESEEGRLKLAETLQKLGEISIEWENNENAVSILEESLTIRKALLPDDHRLIAHTYYHLGLAHSFKQDTPKANENFQNAVDVIERRLKTQTVLLEAAKTAQDTPAIATYQTEINELKELIPDMMMRIDDTKDDDAKNTEVLKRQREEMEQEEEDLKKVCSDRSKPVDDITHLVKRKAT